MQNEKNLLSEEEFSKLDMEQQKEYLIKLVNQLNGQQLQEVCVAMENFTKMAKELQITGDKKFSDLSDDDIAYIQNHYCPLNGYTCKENCDGAVPECCRKKLTEAFS